MVLKTFENDWENIRLYLIKIAKDLVREYYEDNQVLNMYIINAVDIIGVRKLNRTYWSIK